jgi:hypothetical protein
MVEDKKFSIIDLFAPEELQEKGDGNFKVVCPSCGSDNLGYGGMILFVESNTAYCHNSRKWFTMKEVYALQKNIIRCIDGRDTKDE